MFWMLEEIMVEQTSLLFKTALWKKAEPKMSVK